MKIILSKNSNKKLLEQYVRWRDNELLANKGHKRVRNQYGQWIKVKKN